MPEGASKSAKQTTTLYTKPPVKWDRWFLLCVRVVLLRGRKFNNWADGHLGIEPVNLACQPLIWQGQFRSPVDCLSGSASSIRLSAACPTDFDAGRGIKIYRSKQQRYTRNHRSNGTGGFFYAFGSFCTAFFLSGRRGTCGFPSSTTPPERAVLRSIRVSMIFSNTLFHQRKPRSLLSEVFVFIPICSHSEEIDLPSEIDFDREKLSEAQVSGGTAANMFVLREKIQFLPTGFSECQLPTGKRLWHCQTSCRQACCQ